MQNATTKTHLCVQICRLLFDLSYSRTNRRRFKTIRAFRSFVKNSIDFTSKEIYIFKFIKLSFFCFSPHRTCGLLFRKQKDMNLIVMPRIKPVRIICCGHIKCAPRELVRSRTLSCL